MPGRAIDAVNRQLLRAGSRVAPYALQSRRVRDAIGEMGAWAATRRPGRHVEQWRDNVELATGSRPGEQRTRAAVRSYLRNYTESLALPSTDPAEIVARTTTDPAGERRLREAYEGPGVIVALPHLGSWDHAGVWACATGLPVSTVAEQLGPQEFAFFKAYRESLGFRIYSHRDPGVLTSLVADLRQKRFVCLLADRSFDGHGVDVTWPTPCGGTPGRSPAGPAWLARRTGATLLGVAARYTADGIHLVFTEPIEHRPGREGLQQMTQDLVTFFAAEVSRAPWDWHVFVPVFDQAAP